MSLKLISWKLREVMDRHGIRATDLAESMGISKNAVSNLRGVDMPRLDGDRLNSLVLSLNQLRRHGSTLITPSDLIGFSLTPDEMKKLGV